MAELTADELFSAMAAHTQSCDKCTDDQFCGDALRLMRGSPIPVRDIDLTPYERERNFMQKCFDAGWRYSGGMFPSVAGTHDWDTALSEARYWECHRPEGCEEIRL